MNLTFWQLGQTRAIHSWHFGGDRVATRMAPRAAARTDRRAIRQPASADNVGQPLNLDLI
jgi:hypothetical protein